MYLVAIKSNAKISNAKTTKFGISDKISPVELFSTRLNKQRVYLLIEVKEMADHPISTPPSSTGITRFYDVNSNAIQLDPMMVVGFTIALIIIELLLQSHL